MAGFRFSGFRGRYPGVDARVIPENAGTVATDLKLGFGNIRPLFGNLSQSVALARVTPKSLFHYLGSFWMHEDYAASWITAPIGQDMYDRLLWTNDDTDSVVRVAGVVPSSGQNLATSGGAPYPSGNNALGVPSPIAAPTVVKTAGDLGDVEDQTSFFYCFTYVNERGEEGPPSFPGPEVVVNEGLGFSVDVTCAYPTLLSEDGITLYLNVNKVRVYRLFAQDSTQTWMFVGEVATSGSTVTFADVYKTADLPGDTLVSFDWDPPPLGLKHIKALPNGALVGILGNQVCFSEPWFPYAWPAKYRLTTDTTLVSVGVFGSSIALLTVGQPYVASGPVPGEMSMARLEIDQSCVSARSVVDLGDSVVWASPDGLWSIGTDGVKDVTGSFMDKTTWRDSFNPSTIHAYPYEGRYVAFYVTSGGSKKGFTVTPSSPEDGLIDLSFYASAAYRDMLTDTLYLSMEASPGVYGVYAFDSDVNNPLTWRWTSRVTEFPRHINIGRAQVIGTAYPYTLDTSVISDAGVLTAIDTALSVTSRNAIPLSSGTLAADWVASITGTGVAQALLIAETAADLAGV